MKPTNELRYVQRKLSLNPYTGQMLGYLADVRILQQKWVPDDSPIVIEHEWRDVPTVKEQP